MQLAGRELSKAVHAADETGSGSVIAKIMIEERGAAAENFFQRFVPARRLLSRPHKW